MGRIAYVNGDFVPLEDAKISVMDRGFLFADGVYEVTAVMDGHLVDNEPHMARLKRSLSELDMTPPVPVTDIPALQNELIERELRIERESLENNPAMEVRELQAVYRQRGLDHDQARDLAEAVHQDPEVALEVHAREELGIDPDDIGDPVGAAVSSFVAFAIGAVLPLIPWFIGSGNAAMVASVVIGLVAAALVGITLARFTERSPLRTAARQVGWAAGACLITFAIGSLLGTTVA